MYSYAGGVQITKVQFERYYCRIFAKLSF